MDEIETQQADSTLAGQDSPESDESNSTETQTITLEEHKKGIEDAIAQYGDKVKRERIDPIATERNTFKAQVEQLQADAEDATTAREESEDHISKLEGDIKRLEGDDDDPDRISKLRKELRAERETARQGARDEKKANAELKRTLEAEREEWAGTVAEAQAAKFEVDVFEIAEEYVDESGKDIKPERLKALCEKAGQKKREEIEALADVLWTKKGKEKKKEPVLVGDSGVTSGGGLDISSLSPKEKIDAGIAKLKKK